MGTMEVKQGCPLSPTLFGQCICQLEQFIHEAIREHGKPANGHFTVLLLICTHDALLLANSTETAKAIKYGTHNLRALGSGSQCGYLKVSSWQGMVETLLYNTEVWLQSISASLWNEKRIKKLSPTPSFGFREHNPRLSNGSRNWKNPIRVL